MRRWKGYKCDSTGKHWSSINLNFHGTFCLSRALSLSINFFSFYPFHTNLYIYECEYEWECEKKHCHLVYIIKDVYVCLSVHFNQWVNIYIERECWDEWKLETEWGWWYEVRRTTTNWFLMRVKSNDVCCCWKLKWNWKCERGKRKDVIYFQLLSILFLF